MFDIFKISGNKDFFNFLSRPSKEMYWTVINTLYDEVSSVYERKIRRDKAKFIIDKLIFKYNANGEVCKLESYDFINAYLESGWMIQRYDGEEGDEFLWFTPAALSFMKSMDDCRKSSSAMQTNDCLIRIDLIAKNILTKNIDSDSYKYPYRNGILRIMNLLGDCFYQLSSIEQQTNDDIKEILEIKDLQELVNKLRIYIDDLNSGYVHDVYESFNLNEAYRETILQLIDEIEEETEIREKVLWDMREDNKNNEHPKTEEELMRNLTVLLNTLSHKVKVSYPMYKTRIDNSIRKVIEKSLNKMNILTEGHMSYLSSMSRVLELLVHIEEKDLGSILNKKEVKELLAETVNFNRLRIVDEHSLYKRRENSDKEEMEAIIEIPDDEEELVDLDALEMEQFRIEEANQYAKEILGSLDELNISNAFLEEDEIDKIQALYLMVDDAKAEYELVFTGEKAVLGQYQYDEFIVKKL